MTITRDTLLGAIDRIAAAMERDFDLLNSADAALGDGDLGVTMTRGMRAIVAMKDDLPEDIGMALLGCAQAFTKSSGSSYGTLMATGLMSAAKELRGQQEIESESIPGLIAGARDKMQERGKAELGGKTVLDSLDYVARTTDKADDKASAAAEAVDRALEDFRDKPATVGRARIFGEKSIGLDDPGMLAMQSVVRAAVDK
ncbi:PTS-dependent dihydroxyacetone kinase [Dinoroseobacter shibae DFL 12 = DSM 16493]|jgi:dihydroxyacetone kinase-like protein|uniref:PTS-dependent dihydroxyacetone kinase n=1 Tax=Dinoroseobacter shibae (strain DSM 16493 / NCIMB 14021 / DFL 12) TaxID=398580 RepID=A8LNW4_DINSH|nr:dihydroxyacetone kinase subunit L [Dinoroseobacter shibae]ABV92272.1 PTS-dependent dihydroxyacetone kinase [Dinoroseobacter shibae DFL 12 = DSM 16493]URF47226.1 dihydroxyacetone kinase subunit L [Dinoroseobacter shibae]URF51537.1 dihydroxyacetone kinase subunit L [Dinoroseobacter shibae]